MDPQDILAVLSAQARTYLPILLDAGAKGLALLTIAGLLSLCLCRASAATRHLIWSVGLTSLLVLPLCSLMLPAWHAPILPHASIAPASMPVGPPSAPFRHPKPPHRKEGQPTREHGLTPPSALVATKPVGAAPSGTNAPRRETSHPLRLHWSAFALTLWLAGTLLAALPLFVGIVHLSRLTRRAAPLAPSSWATAQRSLPTTMQLPRRVRLLASDDVDVPMTWGSLCPVVLLPTEAADWTDERYRAVLLHELAHVKRWDCLTQTLGWLACAMHWVNPLAWFALHRLRVEREVACDDQVLAAGLKPSTYAGHLLELVRGLGATDTAGVAAVAMARSSSLEARLRAILDAMRARRMLRGRDLAAGLTLAAIVVFPLAALRATRAAPGTGTYQHIPNGAGLTSAVTGTVLDEQAQPVAEVEVVAWSSREGTSRAVRRTSQHGAFRFDDLAPGSYAFSVQDDQRFAKEWVPRTWTRVPSERRRLPLRLRVYRPRSLSGTVVDEAGAPVAGARVWLVSELVEGLPQMIKVKRRQAGEGVTTDEHGRFELPRLRPGKIRVGVDHPRLARKYSGALTVGRGEVRFVLERGMTLHGRVVADDRPLAGVSLRVEASAFGGRSFGEWSLTTDAKGEFAAHGVADYAGMVGTSGPGLAAWVDDAKWMSSRYRIHQLDRTTLPFVEIQARPQEPGEKQPPRVVNVGRLDGPTEAQVLRQPAGAGAIRVTFARPMHDFQGALRLAFLRSTDERAKPIDRRSPISEDGIALFDSLPPGRYRVHVPSLTGPCFPKQTVDLAQGEIAEVTMRKGPAKLTGTIRSGGALLRDGKVQCGPLSPRLADVIDGASGPLRDDGSYEIDGLPFGDYIVVYSRPGSIPNLRRVQVSEAVTRCDLDLPTSRVEGRLVGKVPNPERNDIFVRGEGVYPANAHLGVHVAANEVGQFHVAHLPPGRYTITTSSGDFRTKLKATATIGDSSSRAEVVLGPPQRTGWLAGSLRGLAWDQLKRPRYVCVCAFRKDGDGHDFGVGYQTNVDRDTASYELTGLPVGIYSLLVSCYALDEVPMAWVPNIEVREGLTRRQDIDIPRGRRVHVKISVPGRRRHGTSWRLRAPTGEWIHWSALTSNPLGGTLTLPLGAYEIDAEADDLGRALRAFAVRAGQGVQEIELQVR